MSRSSGEGQSTGMSRSSGEGQSTGMSRSSGEGQSTGTSRSSGEGQSTGMSRSSGEGQSTGTSRSPGEGQSTGMSRSSGEGQSTGTSRSTAERVAEALGELSHAARTGTDGTLVLEVEREHVAEVLAALKQRAGFDANTFVTAVDHEPREPRFEVCWQFLSFAHNDRVRVSCRVAEADASVPTCTQLWPGASFSERECYDMFGIHFDGHPDLRRLLMPEGYTHHPLRKDFPHQGIEPDRLYREWDDARRRASADQ